MAKILISACLLGYKTRYDGLSKPSKKIKEIFENDILIPICPEQMGGLSTPRPKAEIKGDKVINIDGKDVTSNYIEGAKMALEIAKLNDVDFCILKSKSPSCGKGLVYDGSFSNNLISGDGVCTKLLKENGFKIYSEEEIMDYEK